MLTNLTIQGLAIIDSLSIDFSQKLNVITGETGAGKSILIKALSMVLGVKASADMVRNGREQAVVSASFMIPAQHAIRQMLGDLGVLDAAVDGEELLLVRRSINTKGRSQQWINDLPVTQQALKDVGYHLIDIFSQHENQRLLDPHQHVHFIDQFITRKALEEYEHTYQTSQEDLKSLRKLVATFQERLKAKDFLEFRIQELAAFGPSAEDWQRVSELGHKVKDSLKLKNLFDKLQTILDSGSGGESLGRALWEAKRLVDKERTSHASLVSLGEECGTLAAQLDDMSYRLGVMGKDFELDESEIELAEQRVAGYQDLFRKLGVPGIDALLAEEARLRGEIEFLDTALLDVAEKVEHLHDIGQRLQKQAKHLSELRHQAVGLIKKAMTKEMKELNMSGAQLDIEFAPVTHPVAALGLEGLVSPPVLQKLANIHAIMSELGRHGAESAQILLSANPGEALKPLHKIASGGEISRIMLALKKVFSAGAETCVLVFDEIDSGISGKAADMVGLKIKELSRGFQVICISHLAQVAAYADSHFLVEKSTKAGRTESRIVRLSEEQSAEEIARLLSGAEITKPSLDNAKMLVKKAHMHP